MVKIPYCGGSAPKMRAIAGGKSLSEVQEIAQILGSEWGLAKGQLTPYWQGYNRLFRWQGDQVFFVKWTSGKVRTFEEVSANLDYQNHLFSHGAPVPQPQADRSGRFVRRVALAGEGGCISVSGAGVGQQVSPDATDPALFAAWGRAAARLHLAAETYEANQVDFAFLTEAEEWQRTQSRLDGEDAQVTETLMRIADWREDMIRRSSGPILTHGDLNASNALWDGQTVTLIDFDEPMWNVAGADMARPFRENFTMDPGQRGNLWRTFAEAYGEIRPGEPWTPQDARNFATLKNLAIYAWQLAGEDPLLGPGTLKCMRAMIVDPPGFGP